MLAANVVPFASTRLIPWSPVRPGFPSLKMITPTAPAACAFRTFTPKLQPPRWISAIRPDVKPVKSAGVHPLVELDVGVGGRMMPPAGWIAPVTEPLLGAAVQSSLNVKLIAGETTLNDGKDVNATYGNWYF